MLRLMLSDLLWCRLLDAIADTRAYRTENLRMSVEGILWRFRTGAPWRDLPDQFGPWKTVFNRFDRWSKLGVWASLFDLIRGELDDEWNFIDGTYVKAHQHSSGGSDTPEQKTVGRSRGGSTTKIHMLTDAHGNPKTFDITTGNTHDVSAAPNLIEQSTGEHIIGDKGYDSEELRNQILKQGATPHIPRKSNSAKPNPHFDKELYYHRHLVENLFAKLKHFRSFATRYDKLTRNFSSTVLIACIMIWLRLGSA
jgi:transposase